VNSAGDGDSREPLSLLIPPAAIGVIVMLASGFFATALFAPGSSMPTNPRATLVGLRPLAADAIWMSALRAAGDPHSFGSNAARARAVSDRLRVAIRLAPDVRERAWQGALLLGVLDDTAGMRAFFGTCREVMPEDPEVALIEAVWGTWMEEGRADEAVRSLARLWDAGALAPAARRTAVALARISGDTETARVLLERYRRETGDETWARAEERLLPRTDGR
jgi:hypothetical protein